MEDNQLPENTENVENVSIKNKMVDAYLDYAMSVIIGRALPDIRDGLKPVHRRILYAMSQLNNTYNRPFMKSARIVGDVVGKYHPHGDGAIYDAAVRMAQGFNMRYMLIDGQGNFGSVDGDLPAAMRYTEIRMRKITSEMLGDIEKNTVDFVPNYDGSLSEPSVLPSKIPNLLINGSTGIAVGMATNFPPHNLGEVVDGLLYLLDKQSEANTEELLTIVKGPDFPTGGTIMGVGGIRDAYRTGRGIIYIRSKTHVEPVKGSSREALIVTEIPYTVNKAKLIEKIAFLIREKKVTSIYDIRDESDRSGMRIVVELKKGEIPEVTEAFLMKHTQLQQSFGMILLAVSNGKPKEFSLMEALKEFINFRYDVILRRVKFDLNKAEQRAHILIGLLKALENIDEIVETIKASESGQDAKINLQSGFGFTNEQSQAILDMRLQRLTGLEREKLSSEYEELEKTIAHYKQILSSDDMVYGIIKEELTEIRNEYTDIRRTEINSDNGDIDRESMIPDDPMVITITKEGYIKRSDADQYKVQKRGGKGKIGLTTKQEDLIDDMFLASNHKTLLMFSNFGKVYWKKVYELPLASRTGKGRAIVNLLNLDKGENILSCLPIAEYDDSYVIMITKQGIIKKTELKDRKSVV